MAEQCVQNIRDLAATLLEQVKAQSGTEIRTRDEIAGWAYVHASMLQNTFAVRAGTTSFEKAFGLAYNGKLACFGEVVLFALSQGHRKKGRPKFVKGLWLGKSLVNDMHVCGTALGLYLSTTVRRLNPQERWSKHMLKEFQGKPYKFSLSSLGKVVIPAMKDRTKPNVVPDMPVMPMEGPKEAALKAPDEAGSDSSSSSSQSGARESSHEVPGGVSAPSSQHASSTPSEGGTDGGVRERMDIEAGTGQKRSEPEPSAKEEDKRGEKRPMPEEKNVPLNAPPLYAGSSSPQKTSRVSTVKVADAEYYTLDEHLEEEWGDMEEWEFGLR